MTHLTTSWRRVAGTSSGAFVSTQVRTCIRAVHNASEGNFPSSIATAWKEIILWIIHP